MKYKDIFEQAFSDIYTRFPLSDTGTICENVTKRSSQLHTRKNICRFSSDIKDNPTVQKHNKSFYKTVSVIAVMSLVLGAFVGIYYFSPHKNGGIDITSPGYAQKQAEIEESKKLDEHQITDEERSESGTTEVGLTAEFDNINVKVSWYKFDGTDLIIKYSVTFYSEIPDDLSTLPRPTGNTISYPDNREAEQIPSFEKHDIAYRDGNTFYMYSKISPVTKPLETYDVAIDNRRIDGESSPYLFTAIANIPENKQPIETALDKYITLPEKAAPFEGITMHLTKLTLKSDHVIFWFDEIADNGNTTIITALAGEQCEQVIMNDGRQLVFDGGYSGSNTYYSCNLTESNTIDPRDVSEVYLFGEPVYLKSIPKNDASAKYDESNGNSDDIIYIDTTPYGKVRLDTLSLSPYMLELTFTPADNDDPTGGGIVRTQDLSIKLYYHDGSISSISDMPHSFGEEIFADGRRKRTITYDLSDNRVAPQYVGYITINGVPIEISEAGSYDTKEYRGSSAEAVAESGAPFPSAIDAQNIGSSVYEGGLVGTVIDKSITPSENWISLPPENEESIANP